MKNFFKDSIYENLSSVENLVSSKWHELNKKYIDGYSASSYWLSFSQSEQQSLNLRTKSELTYALVQVCRTVNIIRHKFGVGEAKALSVKWASDFRNNNTLDDHFVYLSPAPLLNKSNLTIHQKYDVIVGQAFLCSVQKHIIPQKIYKFLNRCKSYVESNAKLQFSIFFDYGSIYFKSGDEFFFPIISPKKDNWDSKTSKDITPIETPFNYPNNKDFYLYTNINISLFMEWHSIWRAIEQNICEKAISNEYKGSLGYLLAHRNFYLDRKFDAVLKEVVEVCDFEWIPKIWHLLIINKVFNREIPDKMHDVYKMILNLADEILITDPYENSETRFCSVIHLMCKVSELLKDLKSKKLDLFGNETNVDNLSEKLKKKIKKYTDDISKTGIGDSMAKSSDIISKVTHIKLTSSIKDFVVGDEKALRNYALEQFASSMIVKDPNPNNQIIDATYKKIMQENIKYIDFLKNNLIARSYKKIGHEYSMKNGNLDENNLWKLSFNNEESENIFHHSITPDLSDSINITILFDNSGSMENRKTPSRIQICNKIAVILREVTSGLLNSKLDFYSFSNNDFYKFDINPKSVCMQRAEGGTQEGFAIIKAAWFIENYGFDCENDNFLKKHLIVIGDGAVIDWQVKNALKILKEYTNIKFYHIGLDGAYTKEFGDDVYGRDNYSIIPSENLMHKLCSTIVKILS